MPVFPTFRLPYVAAKAVINRMDLGDLTILSLCSKKTRKFIKSLRKPVSFATLSFEQKEILNVLEIIKLLCEDKLARELLKEYHTKVNIQISDDIGFKLDVRFAEKAPAWRRLYFKVCVECIDRQDEYKGARSYWEIDGINIPVVMTKKDEMYTFWNKKEDGFNAIGEYLKEKISPEIFYLDVDGGRKQEYSENLRFVINWMNSTNRIPQNCSIGWGSDDKINEEDVKFILDNIHPTKDYQIWAELGDQFQHNTHFNSDHLFLNPANWFSLENLLMTECKTIRLYESTFTNNDLNAYLKQWIEGKFPKLEYLYINMQEDMNTDIILSDLGNSPDYPVITWRENSVQIERNGGVVGEISTIGSTSKTFRMNISRNHV